MVIKYTEALRFNLSKMKSEIDEMRTRYEIDHPGGSREYSISTTTSSSEYSTAREDKSNTENDFPRTGKHNFLFFFIVFYCFLFESSPAIIRKIEELKSTGFVSRYLRYSLVDVSFQLY